jgi:hypothetical protein
VVGVATRIGAIIGAVGGLVASVFANLFAGLQTAIEKNQATSVSLEDLVLLIAIGGLLAAIAGMAFGLARVKFGFRAHFRVVVVSVLIATGLFVAAIKWNGAEILNLTSGAIVSGLAVTLVLRPQRGRAQASLNFRKNDS